MCREKIRQEREYEVWKGKEKVRFLDSGQRRPSLNKLGMMRKGPPHRERAEGAVGTRGRGHRTPGCPQENSGPRVDGQSRPERGTAGAEAGITAGGVPAHQMTSAGSSKQHGASSHHGVVTRSAWADSQSPRTTLAYGHTTLNTPDLV